MYYFTISQKYNYMMRILTNKGNAYHSLVYLFTSNATGCMIGPLFMWQQWGGTLRSFLFSLVLVQSVKQRAEMV